MNVSVTSDAKEFVKMHGGIAYVRSHEHRCCSGPLTVLDTTIKPPSESEDFVPIEIDDIIVSYLGDPVAQPHKLTIELRGIVRHRLVAYWDECLYRL